MTGVPLDPNKTEGAAPDQENALLQAAMPQNHTALTADAAARIILWSKSSNTETQRARALELLKVSPQTTYTLRSKGLSHCAARIMELRLRGRRIDTSRVTAVDSDGYTHVGVALYSLEVPQWPNS
jgi:hypothetical protein